MEHDWGISADKARSLLKLSKNIFVRTRDKDSSQHAGRAKLIEVLNNEKALIQPLQGHKKNEVVFLSSLKFWTSANEQHGVSISMIPEKSEQVKHVIPKIEYCVISRKNGKYFCGKKKWDINPHLKSIYTDPSDAHRSASHLRKEEGYEDAEVCLVSKSSLILGEQMTTPSISKPVATVSKSSGLDADIDSILGQDSSALINRLTYRVECAKEVKEAEQMLAEAIKKFNEAHAQVLALAGSVSLKKEEQAPTPVVKEKSSRGDLIGAVRKVLFTSSRLDKQSIIDKVVASGFTTSRDINIAISGCLYSMIDKKELNQEEDQSGKKTYGLTAEGREIAEKKMDKKTSSLMEESVSG